MADLRNEPCGRPRLATPLVPLRDYFSFALWRETSFRMRLALLRKRLEPGERIARGDVERSKRQALAQRAADVRSRYRIIFPSPHRHVRPGLHFLLSQKFLVYPGKLRVRLQGPFNSIEHPADAEGFGRPGRVINSCLTVLGHAN